MPGHPRVKVKKKRIQRIAHIHRFPKESKLSRVLLITSQVLIILLTLLVLLFAVKPAAGMYDL
jgi:hypothetical protein